MTIRKNYVEDPLAWDTASRHSFNYDTYNPFERHRARRSHWSKVLYVITIILLLAVWQVLK